MVGRISGIAKVSTIPRSRFHNAGFASEKDSNWDVQKENCISKRIQTAMNFARAITEEEEEKGGGRMFFKDFYNYALSVHTLLFK